jgi:hypothetical protein
MREKRINIPAAAPWIFPIDVPARWVVFEKVVEPVLSFLLLFLDFVVYEVVNTAEFFNLPSWKKLQKGM